MKKLWILICCAAVLAAMLIGCQEPGYLLGTWEGKIDCIGKIIDAMPETDKMKDYLRGDKCVLTVRLTFREDGTYQVALDEEATAAALQELREALTEDAIAYLEEELQERGLSISVKELLETMGLSLEEFTEQYLGEDVIRAITSEMNIEGNYRAKRGKLYLSKSLDAPIEEDRYERYVVSGNELRILKPFGLEMVSGIYPIIFTKVS